MPILPPTTWVVQHVGCKIFGTFTLEGVWQVLKDIEAGLIDLEEDDETIAIHWTVPGLALTYQDDDWGKHVKFGPFPNLENPGPSVFFEYCQPPPLVSDPDGGFQVFPKMFSVQDIITELTVVDAERRASLNAAIQTKKDLVLQDLLNLVWSYLDTKALVVWSV